MGKSIGSITIIATYENEKYIYEITVSERDDGIPIESVKFLEGTHVMTVESTYTPPIKRWIMGRIKKIRKEYNKKRWKK